MQHSTSWKDLIRHSVFLNPSMALAEHFSFSSRQQNQQTGWDLSSFFIFRPATMTTYVIGLVFFVRLRGRGKIAAQKKNKQLARCMYALRKKKKDRPFTLHPITSSSRIPPHRRPQAPSLYAILSSWAPPRSASEGCRTTIPSPRRPLCPRACPPQPRPHQRR